MVTWLGFEIEVCVQKMTIVEMFNLGIQSGE